MASRSYIGTGSRIDRQAERLANAKRQILAEEGGGLGGWVEARDLSPYIAL
jgi:hypothetical protein